MKRQTLDRYQVFIYLAAILAGLAAGYCAPEATGRLDAASTPSTNAPTFDTMTASPIDGVS